MDELLLTYRKGFFGMNNIQNQWPAMLNDMWPFGLMIVLTTFVTYSAAFLGYYFIMGHGMKQEDIEGRRHGQALMAKKHEYALAS